MLGSTIDAQARNACAKNAWNTRQSFVAEDVIHMAGASFGLGMQGWFFVVLKHALEPIHYYYIF